MTYRSIRNFATEGGEIFQTETRTISERDAIGEELMGRAAVTMSFVKPPLNVEQTERLRNTDGILRVTEPMSDPHFGDYMVVTADCSNEFGIGTQGLEEIIMAAVQPSNPET